MAIQKVLIIGNHDLSYAIVGALVPHSNDEPSAHLQVSVLTYPSQSLHLPSHVPPNLVEHKTSDFSDASLRSVFAGHDLVISTIAAGDYDFQARIVDAIVSAGVDRFIPNEFGQDSLNVRVQQRMPQCAARAKVIDLLRQTATTRPTFEWAAAAVGCILDPILLTGDLGFDLVWQSASIHGTGNEHFAASSLERVGTVVARIIQHWDATRNRYLYSAGVLTTAHSILSGLEESTASKWTVGYSDVDDCVREGTSRIQRGFPDSGMFLLGKSILFDADLRAIDAFHEQSANALLRLGPENVDKIVEKAVHNLRHRGKPGCGCT